MIEENLFRCEACKHEHKSHRIAWDKCPKCNSPSKRVEEVSQENNAKKEEDSGGNLPSSKSSKKPMTPQKVAAVSSEAAPKASEPNSLKETSIKKEESSLKEDFSISNEDLVKTKKSIEKVEAICGNCGETIDNSMSYCSQCNNELLWSEL